MELISRTNDSNLERELKIANESPVNRGEGRKEERERVELPYSTR
jgi:hypothetical protein